MTRSNPHDRSSVRPASGSGVEARLVNVDHQRLLAIADSNESSPPRPGLDPAGAEPLSILLVEDEGLIAHDLEETLTRLGYHVSGIASEGIEAIAMARELHPQLVVMDVSLRGEIDGIDAACEIQKDTPV